MDHSQQVLGIGSNRFTVDDLQWLERRDPTGPIFWSDLLTYALTVWPTATKFGTVPAIRVWRASF